MRIFLICSLLCALVGNGAFSFDVPLFGGVLKTGRNLATSGYSTSRAVGTKIPDIIPDPSTVLSMGKEAVAGMPFQVGFEAIKKFCSVAISGDSAEGQYTPDINRLAFVLITSTTNVSIPITEPERIWSSPLFNANNPLVLLITGWLTDLTDGRDTTIDTVWKAYEARGNYNFIVLDSARFIDSMYTWSAFNTEEIGKHVGNALTKLARNYPREKIHVVGHSLGAQISGAAGRYFKINTDTLLPRITGLDPANPCFNEGEALTGIYRGDAEFVDIIHTNSGALGQRQPVGDVDFFVNGVVALQPGCFTIVCAHGRAWEYWAESVYPGNENNFLAIRCNSMTSLRQNLCPGNTKIAMGYSVPRNAKGNFFLGTGSSTPYGQNAKPSLATVI